MVSFLSDSSSAGIFEEVFSSAMALIVGPFFSISAAFRSVNRIVGESLPSRTEACRAVSWKLSGKLALPALAAHP